MTERAWPVWIACSIAACLVAMPAAAAELEVAWRGPDCARRDDFEHRLRSALQDAPEALLDAPLAVGVEIAARTSGGFSLHLTTRQENAELSRVLETASCVEAVEAAALIVALAIDPGAGLALPIVEPARAELALHGWALGGVSYGELPRVSPLFGAGLGLGLGDFRVGAEGFWELAQRAWLAGDDARGGEIGLAGAGPLVCYAPHGKRLGVLACLNSQVGAWRSQGIGVSNPEAARRLWLGSAARLGLRLRLHRILNGLVATDLQFAWRRPAFVLDALGQVYRPGPVGVRLTLGVELVRL